MSNDLIDKPTMVGQIEDIQQQRSVLSTKEFLSQVDAIKADILTTIYYAGQIALLRQNNLEDPWSSRPLELERLIGQTELLNVSIKEHITSLTTDATYSNGDPTKYAQVKQLKNSFSQQLQDYRQEECEYKRRYREQIKRQYEIVNPEATEEEKEQATWADWGSEGVFQSALKSNRSVDAKTTLGSVRARHEDIQKIERTILELDQLMEELSTTVLLQEEPISINEQYVNEVREDVEYGTTQLSRGVKSARRARRTKWWCLAISLCIIVVLILVLTLYFSMSDHR